MKKNLWRLLKGLCVGIAIIVSVVFTIYSMAWFSLTKKIETQFKNEIAQKNFTVTDAIPHFSGYPSVPHAKFSGTLEHKSGLKIITPEILYTGFPAMAQVQTFEAPQGLKVTATFLDRDLNFDYAYLQIALPKSIPFSGTRGEIQAWQKSNDAVIVRQILLKSGNIYARGDGTISLDDDLQIKADINARIVGLDILFDELAQEKGERTVAIARSFFNMVSQVDDKTGERYFQTTLKIQKQGIFLGPMRITGLPKLEWK